MQTLTLVLQLVLGLAQLTVAAASVTARPWLIRLTRSALVPLASGSRAARWPVAVLALLGGALALASIAMPFLAFFAACFGVLAAIVLAWRRAAPSRWALPAMLGACSVMLAMAQPLGLKVLALPKAAELPLAKVRATVIKNYEAGTWFEGIAAGPDGTLYLAANRGLDFARSDYYRSAQGEVLARSADGKERSVFKTPAGSAAGVLAVAPDGVFYMTSHGDDSGVWRMGADGKAERFVSLPKGAWPNGIDIGPDGMLYIADSKLGVIWRADRATRIFSEAIPSDLLLARPLIALAPGANGVHFRGRELLVTVSDRTTVLSATLQGDGSFTPFKTLASGIPGDDFAIGSDGSLFITTHPYNTVVKVAPSGERSIIAGEAEHIVGATDAVFGRGPADRQILYVVTDGGAFTGGPGTRGALVALAPYGN